MAPMGVLASASAHADPLLSQWTFFRCTCIGVGWGDNFSPFQEILSIFLFSKKTQKFTPKLFLLTESYFFVTKIS